MGGGGLRSYVPLMCGWLSLNLANSLRWCQFVLEFGVFLPCDLFSQFSLFLSLWFFFSSRGHPHSGSFHGHTTVMSYLFVIMG